MATHKECTNFSWKQGGWCNLKDKSVPPDGQACEYFTPRMAFKTY